MKAALFLFGIFVISAFSLAGDKGYDVTKLPEGAIYEGTFSISNGSKVTFSSGLEIKITKREKTKFEGEWTETNNGARAKIEGTISSNKVSFKFVKELKGKFPKDVIGNAEASGTLAVSDGDAVIRNGTYVVPGQKRTGKWEVKEKKD